MVQIVRNAIKMAYLLGKRLSFSQHNVPSTTFLISWQKNTGMLLFYNNLIPFYKEGTSYFFSILSKNYINVMKKYLLICKNDAEGTCIDLLQFIHM